VRGKFLHTYKVPVLFSVVLFTGQLGLTLLRSSKNALASPMIVNIDVKPNIFAYSTRFNTKVNSVIKFKIPTTISGGELVESIVFSDDLVFKLRQWLQ
jgi:hypothetical protein